MTIALVWSGIRFELEISGSNFQACCVANVNVQYACDSWNSFRVAWPCFSITRCHYILVCPEMRICKAGAISGDSDLIANVFFLRDLINGSELTLEFIPCSTTIRL